jgi:hypothetical protein
LQIAAQMLEEHGSETKGAAIEFANSMLDHRERERQVEWLRVRAAIAILSVSRLGQTE